MEVVAEAIGVAGSRRSSAPMQSTQSAQRIPSKGVQAEGNVARKREVIAAVTVLGGGKLPGVNDVRVYVRVETSLQQAEV